MCSVPTSSLLSSPSHPETGGVLIAPRPAPNDHTPKPGFPMRPFYGVQPLLMDEKVQVVLQCQLLPLCTCEVQLTALYHIWHSVIPLPCLLCSLIVDFTRVGRVWRLASLLLFGWNFKFKIHTGLGCKLANLVEFLEMVSTDFLSVYITFLFSCTFGPPNCAATIQEITYTYCSFVPRPPPFAFTTIHS